MNEKNLNEVIKSENRKRLIGFILIAVGFIGFMFTPIVGAPLAIIGFFLAISATNNLKNKVGNTLAREVLGEYFDDFTYEPEGYFNEHLFDDVDMALPGYNRLSANDFITATYKDHKLKICDLTLEEVYNDGKHTHTTTVFQGPFIEATYDKDIKIPVTVAKDKFTLFKKSIDTESEEFNNRFNVYSDSEHDAFFILTPHMMERVAKVNDLAGDDIFINFNIGKLYFAIDNHHNNFELDMSQKSVDDIKQDFKKDMDYILEVLDELLEGLD